MFLWIQNTPHSTDDVKNYAIYTGLEKEKNVLSNIIYFSIYSDSFSLCSKQLGREGVQYKWNKHFYAWDTVFIKSVKGEGFWT